MWFGQARFFRATVATVAALVWFAGTHHCLLGLLMQPQSRAVSACDCPNHSNKSGEPDNGPSRMQACCQGLLSPNFEITKAKTAFSPVLVAIQVFAIAHPDLSEAPKGLRLSARSDTGPPSTGPFLEIVLRCSLRENAPPLAS